MENNKIIIHDFSKTTPIEDCMFLCLKCLDGFYLLKSVKKIDSSELDCINTLWVSYRDLFLIKGFRYTVSSGKDGRGRVFRKCKNPKTIINKIINNRK